MVALLALAALVQAQVELTPALQRWHAALEKGGVRVLFARVHTDSERNLLILPAETPERPLFAAMLAQRSFVEMFVHAHALTANLPRASLVFLNMKRAAEWEGYEEALLAHEMAHIALNARGFDRVRAPDLAPCQVTHATNIVQHVLVRRELQARGIDEVGFRIRLLQAVASTAAEAAADSDSVCDKARRLEMWVDTALGLTNRQWPGRTDFLALLRERWPELAEPAAALIAKLEGLDLVDRAAYARALAAAAETLRQLK